MPRKLAPLPVDDRPPPRKPSARSSVKARQTAARLTAVQIIYQADISGRELPATLQEFVDYRIGQIIEGDEIIPADRETLNRIVEGVDERGEEIATILAQSIRDMTLERIEPLLRAILRAGTAELMLHRDVPHAIIIHDYISVTDAFYSGPEIKLVNAVLDTAARIIRPTDFPT